MWDNFLELLSINRSPLPDGLPRNWPYSSEIDLADCPNRIVDVGKEQGRKFRNNSVKTSKYELYDFLPKFLLEEFNPKIKIANCYFLIICALQCIPEISNTAGIPTTLVPLTFIVIIDGLFCAMEDYVRHRADTVSNSSKTFKLIPQTEEYEAHFKTVLWSDVMVGDILRVRNRETVPCDVVLIDVAPTVGVSEGVCFVETKSIDGETNLKSRNTLNFNKSSLLKSKKQPLWYNKLRGQIEMEHPNNLVDSFSGVFSQHVVKKDDHSSDSAFPVRKSLVDRLNGRTSPNSSKANIPVTGTCATPTTPSATPTTPTASEDGDASKDKERERSMSPTFGEKGVDVGIGAKDSSLSFSLSLSDGSGFGLGLASGESQSQSHGVVGGEKLKSRDPSARDNVHPVPAEVEKFPILLGNILLRGCVVRSNDWVVGIALSTGHDSKIMMTSTSSASKLSSVEIETSKIIKRIIMFLLSLGLVASIGQIIWNDAFKYQIDYLDWDIKSSEKIGIQWILILTTMTM